MRSMLMLTVALLMAACAPSGDSVFTIEQVDEAHAQCTDAGGVPSNELYVGRIVGVNCEHKSGGIIRLKPAAPDLIDLEQGNTR